MAEVELRGERTALTIDRGVRIGRILERRRATVQRHHVRPGPGARRPIDEGLDVLRRGITGRPRAEYVPDLVGKHPEQGAPLGILEKRSVDLDRSEAPLPGAASPTGKTPGNIIVLHIDLESGARLAFRPDKHP